MDLLSGAFNLGFGLDDDTISFNSGNNCGVDNNGDGECHSIIAPVVTDSGKNPTKRMRGVYRCVEQYNNL